MRGIDRNGLQKYFPINGRDLEWYLLPPDIWIALPEREVEVKSVIKKCREEHFNLRHRRRMAKCWEMELIWMGSH